MTTDGILVEESARAAATCGLWEHRDRRIPAVAAASAITGRPAAILEDASRICFALSCDLEAILEGMGERVRALPSTLADSPQRMTNSVRGPVMWAETVTARANSFGGDDLFVCRTVRRDFDCPANRLLVWLLERAAAAGRLLRRPSAGAGITQWLEPGTIRRVEEVGAAARVWRTSARLATVPARLPGRIELKRLRGTRRGYTDTETLLAGRALALQPFGGREIAALTDRRTGAEHKVLVRTFEEAAGPDFVVACSDNTLSSGGLQWRHRNHGHIEVQPADS